MNTLPIIDILCRDLDWKVREKCVRRYNFLCRQYSYLSETNDRHLLASIKAGWFEDKFKALFALNSFYQIVIGPLASATRDAHNSIGIGTTTTITYGKKIKFNTATLAPVYSAYNDFLELTEKLGFSEWLLVLNQTSDIAYNIARNIESE
jgi:hypothetical protein